MHRFFLSPDHFGEEQVSLSDAPLLHQWVKVLRLKAGEDVILCDGNQNEYRSRIVSLDLKHAALEIESSVEKKEVFPCDVHLYVPPTNTPSRFELVLEKCTELGVKSITPLITKRTQEKQLRKVERLHAIIREASEQSGRTILPLLNKETPLSVALASLPDDATALLAYTGEAPALYSQKVTRHPSFHVFIGPEGDFDEEELLLFRDSGVSPFSLGKQILRVETAAIASATLLLCR